MAIMGDKMKGLHFKPSLEDCEDKKIGKVDIFNISLGNLNKAR